MIVMLRCKSKLHAQNNAEYSYRSSLFYNVTTAKDIHLGHQNIVILSVMKIDSKRLRVSLNL